MNQTDRDGSRYAELMINDGTVIYDRENHDAWIQSDYAIEVGPYG
ncbi:MAG: hypothetical protein ABEI52_08845 [Halobacteriaceae archaeon]